jgi:hypothetical protein
MGENTNRHIPHNALSFHYCSCDEILDDVHPFDLMYYVHYDDDSVADNCYYLSQGNVVSLNPYTDCNVDSLLPLPA